MALRSRLFRRLQGTRRSAAPELPRVGPFASLPRTVISSLSSVSYESGGTLSSSTLASPFKYDTFTAQSAEIIVPPTASYAFFLWCNHFTIGFDGAVIAAGSVGGDGLCGGGNGGSGGSGGGGGGGALGSCTFATGGSGGSGDDGIGGDSVGASGGFGGQGYGLNYAGFAWPSGDDGTSAGCGGGGSGGAGYGGGGAGGGASGSGCCCSPSLAGGGGGGGKLLAIVCNYTNFNASSSNLSVAGGNGGGSQGIADAGGAGGKGAIRISTKQWANPPSSITGNIEVYEINHAGTTETRRLDYATATWNNN